MWKMIVCDICGREIVSSGIKPHLQWHKTEKQCGFCGKSVYGRNRFCNSACAARFNKNRKGTGEYHTCICGKLVRRKYCSHVCQHRAEDRDKIERWLNGKLSGGYRGNKDVVGTYVKRWLFERAEGKCEAILDDGSRCGWARINPKTGKVPLNVHH
jgi:predicted nucleic acid-binding Zn ribbon protein